MMVPALQTFLLAVVVPLIWHKVFFVFVMIAPLFPHNTLDVVAVHVPLMLVWLYEVVLHAVLEAARAV